MLPELYRQTMHVARWQSTSARGDHTHGAPEAHPCRYEPSVRLLRNSDGGQSVSEAVLFTAAEVDVRDLVYPPGADHTDYRQSRRALRIDRHYELDSGNFSHSEVHL